MVSSLDVFLKSSERLCWHSFIRTQSWYFLYDSTYIDLCLKVLFVPSRYKDWMAWLHPKRLKCCSFISTCAAFKDKKQPFFPPFFIIFPVLSGLHISTFFIFSAGYNLYSFTFFLFCFFVEVINSKSRSSIWRLWRQKAAAFMKKRVWGEFSSISTANRCAQIWWCRERVHGGEKKMLFSNQAKLCYASMCDIPSLSGFNLLYVLLIVAAVWTVYPVLCPIFQKPSAVCLWYWP